MKLRSAIAVLLCAALGTGLLGAGTPAEDPLLARVVCVSKQLNEFLYSIGAQGHLVGRDLTSVYPPEIKKLPSVGYHRALSPEGILSLKPTLFLTDGNVGPNEVLEQLRKVGVPILVLRPGSGLDSAQTLMLRLGETMHAEEAARAAVAKWKSDMDAVRKEAARFEKAKKPRVLILHFGQIINNYLAMKRGGPADQILEWSGAENAVDSIGGMSRVTPELIARAAPDVTLATDVGFDRLGSAEKFAALPGVSLTPAGKAGRIYRIEEHEIMYFTPRTPQAVARLRALIHP